ncbi:MAG: cupin domain-containing protein [Acinetobacter sp.]|uniref:cupin domain-containing protein n=1 Tax=Acinetobacter sp. TaxID=472 RepID=UPI0026DECD4C|nr:cupin domain-containing protein [Acinetobacter sp.]MDO5542056.1 cupin domain-containing protein [Acinetobacter sp.]
MEQLATLEDLPKEYVQDLTQSNLVPLWPSLRNVLPPQKPTPQTIATAWYIKDIKPLLLEAGELTPIEKAERRVLVLANPGHGLENMKASSVMYLGMQLLLPKEWAPSHRHTPNAVRMIVEGEGAYTTVEGQKCLMEHGDLILTPSGLWHEHGHDGDEPVIWLDVLDLPLVYYMEASYVQPGEVQQVTSAGHSHRYGAGVVPTRHFVRENSSYPIMRYSWKEIKKVLHALAADEHHAGPVEVAYINPETGEDCQKIIGYSALMLRPKETVQLQPRSCAQVFHVIDGQVQVKVDDQNFNLAKADTACAPCFAQIDLINTTDSPCYVFVADEAPVQKKLGVYSVRERN